MVDLTAQKIRYSEREDTVRCVVQSLTGDNDLFGELADGGEIEDEVSFPLHRTWRPQHTVY
jgi:hypothetical protein